MSRLNNGDRFPDLTFGSVGGGTLSLPGDLAGSFGVVLIYRGSWCPSSNAQLAALAHAADRFTELGIKVAALSVDDEAAGAELISTHHLGFPLGYGADAGKVAAATGAYTNEEPRYLESTGFVLAPDCSVITTVYSSGAIGGLVPEDVAGLVGYLKGPTMTPTETMRRYFEFWNARDFDAFEAQLADDITIAGPLGTATGTAACRRGMEGLAERMDRAEVLAMVADGPQVLTWFDFHTPDADPVPAAYWAQVEAGRVWRVRVAFDPRPLLG
jgi:peroxiredoxin